MKERSSSIDTLFVVVLLCAFAGAVLLSLLLGARVYGAMNKNAGKTYNRRTCAAYIRNHTCSQCGNYFDFELNRHGSRILCDECLAMIEEAEENGTPVLRKVKAEDVPPAIREKLGG